MGDAWKTAMDMRYKAKKLKLVVEFEDGDVVMFEGEHLRADIRFTPAGMGQSFDVQDPPYVILPMRNEKLTLEFCPEPPPSRLSINERTRLDMVKGPQNHFDASTRWLYQDPE